MNSNDSHNTTCVCSYCNSIINEDGTLQPMDDNALDCSQTAITHGVCQQCKKEQLDKLNE